METQNKKVNLFLDSGAFSAYTQGTTVDLNEYIEFIKEHENIIDVYANLDVIGDAEATWINQRKMEKAGLHPLPVYHLDDSQEYLHRYLDKYEYIGLGGMARGVVTNTRTKFLDRCFHTICDTKDRLPKVKVHGFGLTSLRLMMRYPWYSVDSTSWVVTGRVGSVFIPKRRNGRYIYDEDSWKIVVSTKSPDKKEAGKHISTLTPGEKKILCSYIEEKGYKLGKSEFHDEKQDYVLKENEKWAQKKPTSKTDLRNVETIVEPGISNKYQLRDEMNIIYFLDLEKSMPEWPWPFKTEIQKKIF